MFQRILFVAIVSALAVLVYLALRGVCTVTVTNTGSRTLNVAADAAHVHIGTARLAPGEHMFRFFLASETDGEVGVACREEDSTKTFYKSSGYVSGYSARYAVKVRSCTSIGWVVESHLF